MRAFAVVCVWITWGLLASTVQLWTVHTGLLGLLKFLLLHPLCLHLVFLRPFPPPLLLLLPFNGVSTCHRASLAAHECMCAHVRLFANPWTCSLPGSSVHEISQARILKWVAITSSRGSSWPRDRIHVSCISCIGHLGRISGKLSTRQCKRCRRHGFSPWRDGRKSPGGGNGNPLQYSCLGNPVDRGGWQAIVHKSQNSQTRTS